MAASIDGEQPGRFGLLPQSGGPELPRLILITLAPLSAAYRIPAATFSSLPPMNGELPKITSQKLPRAFTGINLALNATPASSMPSLVSCPRSEERRVGKECRSRWSAHHQKELNKRHGHRRRHVKRLQQRGT